MDSNEKEIRFEDEEKNAEKALQEWEGIGNTNHRCLRCGRTFIFEITPSAYRIQCEKKKLFLLNFQRNISA